LSGFLVSDGLSNLTATPAANRPIFDDIGKGLSQKRLAAIIPETMKLMVQPVSAAAKTKSWLL